MRSISHGQQSESQRLSAFVYFEMIHPFPTPLPLLPHCIQVLLYSHSLLAHRDSHCILCQDNEMSLRRIYIISLVSSLFFLKYLLLLSLCMHNYYFAAVSALSFIISERTGAGAGRRRERGGEEGEQ